MRAALVAALVTLTLLGSLAAPAALARQAATRSPAPIVFPRDEGPHPVRSEWWYYTGHLVTADGHRYGFEEVFFHGHQGLFTGYAAHFAITDDNRHAFTYAQRRTGEGGVAKPAAGFDLTIGDWQMRGLGGHDTLRAAMPGYTLALSLTATKPAVLHGSGGYVDLGPAGTSAYYSRTRMRVRGTMTVDGQPLKVTGDAWMDHQWGDFSAFALGGWSWFAMQLADGSDLMLYLVRDAAQRLTLAGGTFVAANGAATHLAAGDFVITPQATWTSPHSGNVYPARWQIRVPDLQLALTLTPTMTNQELDTRRTTAVVYWEGEVTATGHHGPTAVRGPGYVELIRFGNASRTPAADQRRTTAAWMVGR